MSKRVAILTNIPAPYRLPLFRQIASQYELEVVFDSHTEPNRSWSVPEDMGFRHRYARGLAITYRRHRSDLELSDDRYLQVRPGILPALTRIRPDVIVSAEMGLRSIQAAFYAGLTGTPLILWWEGTLHTEGWVAEKKRRVRRYLVEHAARFWANGKESAALLQQYGAQPAQIDQGMIGIDTHNFGDAVRNKLAGRDATRRELGLSGTVFLFVGQFVARKGIEEFTRALDMVGRPTSVLVIGEGPQRSILEQWHAQHPECNLRILDFQQPAQLPAYYAAADVFVLPTLDDNWSLVALEAAVAGLPQIFSEYNGVTQDLLAHRAAGLVVNPCNSTEFAAGLRRYAENIPSRLSDAEAAAIADFYSPEACARRAVDSIEAAIPSRRRTQRSRSAARASAG